MKKALLHKLEPGRICEITDTEFEVHENFYWVEVPDDTNTADRYNEDGSITKFDPVAQPGFAENAYKIARGIGYGSLGNQLDMLYHELISTGSIGADGPWATHIASIKSAIPKDDPATVMEWNRAYLQSLQSNTQINIM